MAIYINEKLKQFRKEHDLTQEQLANIFNVSPQSVSRWETGATYPDMELLPSIASHFNVTVDELLGVDKIKDTKLIEELDKEILKKWSKGHIDEVLRMSRNAVREFPHEYNFQICLALALSMKIDSDDKNNKNLLESIKILEHIIENCVDDNIRHRALFNLSQNYIKAGNKAKAIETAKKLPILGNSSQLLLTQLYEGEELHDLLKNNIINLTGTLVNNLDIFSNSMYNFNENSDDKIFFSKKIINIIEIIFENGDYGHYHHTLFYNNMNLSRNYYKLQNFENALNCLEKAAQHAIAISELSDDFRHTSVAVRGTKNTMIMLKNSSTNQSYDMLNELNHNFDLLKDDERFKTAISNLEKHAKSE